MFRQGPDLIFPKKVGSWGSNWNLFKKKSVRGGPIWNLFTKKSVPGGPIWNQFRKKSIPDGPKIIFPGKIISWRSKIIFLGKIISWRSKHDQKVDFLGQWGRQATMAGYPTANLPKSKKSGNPLKINILTHNQSPKNIRSIRYTQYANFLFWTSRK